MLNIDSIVCKIFIRFAYFVVHICCLVKSSIYDISLVCLSTERLKNVVSTSTLLVHHLQCRMLWNLSHILHTSQTCSTFIVDTLMKKCDLWKVINNLYIHQWKVVSAYHFSLNDHINSGMQIYVYKKLRRKIKWQPKITSRP